MGKPSTKSIAAKRTKSPSPRTPRRAPGKLGVDARDPGFALVDQVYVAIRDAIRERSLVPGQRLVERDLAEWLKVSRTPVREALRLLEAHGLASTLAGAGLVVTSLSRSEVSELYFAWEELEAITARRAAEVAMDSEIAALKQLQSQWDPNGDAAMLSELNKRFHVAIRYAAHNEFLSRALRTVHDSVSLLGLSTYSLPGRSAEIGREHQAIVDAVARRDPDGADAAARLHIQRNGQVRMSLLMDMDETNGVPRHPMSRTGRA